MNQIDPVKLAEEASPGLHLYNEQKEMIYPMFEALQKKGVAFVGQGPTGMGKTYVVAAVTKALVATGKRVCISVPSYLHLAEVMSPSLRKLGIQFSVVRGLTALRKEKNEGCPLKQMEIPSPLFCSESREAKTGPNSERCNKIDCTVRRELASAKDAKVVLTVFHKLIYNPKMIGDFDVTIFDESHGLEDAVRNGRIAKIRKSDLELLKSFAGNESNVLTKCNEWLDRIARTSKGQVNPMIVEREFVNTLKTVLPKIETNIREAEASRAENNSSVMDAYFTLSRSVNSIDRLDSYRFVYHNESILGIPSTIFFARFNTKQISKDTSVALISATIESPKFHIKEAGFPSYVLAPPVQVESGRLVEERFKKRPIFGLVDGPIMRKDPNFKEAYREARTQANQIIGDLVSKFEFPTLILCRSGDDARNIEASFRSTGNVYRRIFLFEDEETKTDLDILEKNLNEKIGEGQDIIITTAASRLWEGVNLNQLRFLIIDALPYASPQPYDNLERNVWSSWRTSRTFRFMIRRMQQGVGRLVRTDEHPWGIVVVIDGRFNAQWNTIRTALPKYMTDPGIVSFVTRGRISEVVLEKVNGFSGQN